MAERPEDMTVDFTQLMRLSVTNRVSMAQSPQGQALLSRLSPTEYTALFPRFYERMVPKYSSLQSAASGGTPNFGGAGQFKYGGVGQAIDASADTKIGPKPELQQAKPAWWRALEQQVAAKAGPASSGMLPNEGVQINQSGYVNKQQFFSQAVRTFAGSSLNGFVPKDGEKYGIDGTPQSWARFAMRIAKVESNFNVNVTNKDDPGGSLGLFQFGYHYGITKDNWRDPQAQLSAFTNYANKWVVGGGGYILPPNNVKANRYHGYGGFGAVFSTVRNNKVQSDEAMSESMKIASSVMTAPNETGAIQPKRPEYAYTEAEQKKLKGVDPRAVQIFERLQRAYGKKIGIESGFRDPEHNAKVGGAKHSQHTQGNALDLNTGNLPIEERIKIIKIASAMGFTGIGVYANNIHIDIGPKRYWGPSHSADSLPAWAKDTIDGHMSGKWNDETIKDIKAPDFTATPVSIPAGYENLPEALRSEIDKLPDTQKNEFFALMQRAKEAKIDPIQTLTAAYTASQQNAAGIVENITEAPPGQIPSILTGDLEGVPIPSVGPVGVANRFSRTGRDPNPKLKRITTPYGNVTVDESSAVAFKGFLGDMYQAGAPLKQPGSYNKRKKRWSSGWSEHAHGNAIDFDDEVFFSKKFIEWQKNNPGKYEELKSKWGIVQPLPKNDPAHHEFGGTISQQAADEIAEQQKNAPSTDTTPKPNVSSPTPTKVTQGQELTQSQPVQTAPTASVTQSAPPQATAAAPPQPNQTGVIQPTRSSGVGTPSAAPTSEPTAEPVQEKSMYQRAKEYIFGAEETATPTATPTAPTPKSMAVSGEIQISSAEPKSMAVGGEVLAKTKGGLNNEPPGENVELVARDKKTGREKPIANANDREKIVQTGNPAQPKIMVNPSQLDLKKDQPEYSSATQQAQQQQPDTPLVPKYDQENILRESKVPTNPLELKNQNPDRSFVIPKQYLTASAFRAQQVNAHFRETNDYYGEHSSVIT